MSYHNLQKVALIFFGLLMASGSAIAELICDFNGGYNVYYLPYRNVTVSYTATNCGALYDTQLYANGAYIGSQCQSGSTSIADASAGIRFKAQKTGVLQDTFYGWWVLPATYGYTGEQCVLLYEDGGAYPIGEGRITLNGTRIAPVLSVDKSASAPVLVAKASGQKYTITINVTYAPTTAATTLSDVLPAGITTSGNITLDTTNSSLLSGCPAAGATSLAGCTIAAGAKTPIVVTVPVNVAVTAANPVTNTATVTGGGDTTCPTAARCTSAYATPVISAVDDADTSAPGVASSTNVSVNDKFPVNATFTVTGGTCSGTSPVSPATNTTGVLGYTVPLASPSCTVLYKVCAPAPNSTVCGSATLTVTPRPTTIAVSKSLGSARANTGDQFTVQIKDSSGTVASATTTGAGSSVIGGATGNYNATVGTTYTITEVAASGNLAQYTSTVTCNNSTAGGTVFSGSTPLGRSITPALGDAIACVISNTAKAPQLTVKKVTTVGTGTFTFKGSAVNANGFSTSDNYTVSTSTAGTASSGSTVTLAAFHTVTEVQETVPPTWVLTSASCIDNNGAATGNTGTFGTLTDSTLRIDAANVLAGANLLCTYINGPALPTLGLTQTVFVLAPAVFNPPAPFTYNGNNGWTQQTLQSAWLAPAKITGPTQTLAALNTDTTISVTLPSEGRWRILSIRCSDTNAGVSGNAAGILVNTATASFTLPAALVKAGSVFVCDVRTLRN